MNLLQAAEEAIRYARFCTPLGSGNKTYGRIRAMPPSKRHKYGQARMDRLHHALLPEFGGLYDYHPGAYLEPSTFIRYGRLVRYFGAGNCGDQCAAAMAYLHPRLEAEGIFWDYVELGPPGDHGFLVLGQPVPDLRSVMAGGFYPRSFSNWDEQSVVCDPWAKIRERSPRYPARWRETLRKWDDRKMEIDGERPTRPTDPKWLYCLDTCDKKSGLSRQMQSTRL